MENNNDNIINNPDQNGSANNSNDRSSRKSLFYSLLAILIIVGAILGFREYQKNKNPDERLSLRDITQLQEEERVKALEERIKELDDQVKNFAADASSSTKYTTLIQLAEAQLELKRYDAAMESLNRIPEDKRSNSRYNIAMTRAIAGKGDTAKAKEMSANNIKSYPEEPSAWLTHIELNQDLPNDQLNALYRQAIPATKSHIDIMISYARFAERIGDKATAIAAWETAINVDPNNASKYQAERDRLNQSQ